MRLIVVPRLLTRVASAPQQAWDGSMWKDTRLELPPGLAELRWHNLFTGESLNPQSRGAGAGLAAADVLAHLPVALLMADAKV